MLLASFILIFISSSFITNYLISKQKNKNGRILYLLLIFISQIVLIFEVLSLFGMMRKIPFLVGNIIVFCSSFIFCSRKYFNKEGGQNFGVGILKESLSNFFCACNLKMKKIYKVLKQDRILIILFYLFCILILSKILVLIYNSELFGDSLSYYLPRVTAWLWQGSINHFYTPDSREIIMPVNIDLLYSWVLMFNKDEKGIGIFSFVSYIGVLYLIYNILGEIGFCIRRRIWAIFVFSSFVIIAIMSYNPLSDLIIGFFILSSVYLYLISVKYKEKIPFYFSALALALAAGSKVTAIIVLPSVAFLLCIISYFYSSNIECLRKDHNNESEQTGIWEGKVIDNTKPEENLLSYTKQSVIQKSSRHSAAGCDIGFNKKEIILFTGIFVINFIIFSSYNYVLNIIDFNNPFSNYELYMINKFQGGFKGYICCLIKYIFAIFDFSGISIFDLYNDFITKMQNLIINIIGETPDSYMSDIFKGNFEFDNNLSINSSALGALGLFAFLPSLILSFRKTNSKKYRILLMFSIMFILNILIFTGIMIYTKYNLRYLATFVVIATPVIALSYIKDNRNIYKWIISCLIAIYFIILTFYKPFILINTDKEYTNISDEKIIFRYFKNMNNQDKAKIAFIAQKIGSPVYYIEKLKLLGFMMDKIPIDDIKKYNLQSYNYIITASINAQTTNIKNYSNSNCKYYDSNGIKNEQLYGSDERIFRKVKTRESERTRECEGELNDKRSAVKHSSEIEENSRQHDTGLNKRTPIMAECDIPLNDLYNLKFIPQKDISLINYIILKNSEL